MLRRSQAREVAFQVLYQDDLNPHVKPAEGDRFIERRLRADDMIAFARELVAGVRKNRAEVDARLEEIAANWSLKRMAATDRNVLRLGAYELLIPTRRRAGDRRGRRIGQTVWRSPVVAVRQRNSR